MPLDRHRRAGERGVAGVGGHERGLQYHRRAAFGVTDGAAAAAQCRNGSRDGLIRELEELDAMQRVGTVGLAATLVGDRIAAIGVVRDRIIRPGAGEDRGVRSRHCRRGWPSLPPRPASVTSTPPPARVCAAPVPVRYTAKIGASPTTNTLAPGSAAIQTGSTAPGRSDRQSHRH